MHRKNLLMLFVLIILVGVFVYPQVFGGNNAAVGAVGISEVSATPEQYVGNLTIAGAVGGINAEEGIIFLVDEGGCCNIALPVPLSQEQQEYLNNQYDIGIENYYSGTMPSMGDFLEASGTWNELEPGVYLFKVDAVTRNGQDIISKVN